MNFDIFFIGCFIVALPRDVNAVSPHSSNVTDRQRQLIKAVDDDVIMDTVGLVEQYGYSAKEHTITSKDGYNVKIFRIFGSPKSLPAEGKPVVYIQHGLTASSDCWVLIGSGYDLALLLADDGYDVWLGNVRGNTYGKSHNNLTTNDKEFWNFSYHEMATLDLPAAIDHVLKQSGQTDLIYIGCSTGTTMSYVILSEMPEYNKKIRLAISLAPIAFWNQQKINPALRIFCYFTDTMRVVFNFFRIYQSMPQGSLAFTNRLCNAGWPSQFICIFINSVLYGRDPKEFNWDLMRHMGLYNPAGSSMKIFYHIQQNVNAGVPQKYDYGQSDNIKIYGTKHPPMYNLSKITAPFALIYAESDEIANKKNVDYLAGMLSNVVTVEAVPFSVFSHVDFLWGTNAKRLVYDRVIELVSIYSNNWTNKKTPGT